MMLRCRTPGARQAVSPDLTVPVRIRVSARGQVKRSSGEVLAWSTSAVPPKMSMASDLYTDLALSWHLPLSLLGCRFCWLLLIFLPNLGLACCPLPDVCGLSSGAAKPWKERRLVPYIPGMGLCFQNHPSESQEVMKSFWWSLEYSGPQRHVWREIWVLRLCLVTALG